MSLPSLQAELTRPGGPSAITLVDLCFSEAVSRGASDVHLLPTRDGLRMRLRIDGVLRDVFSFPSTVRNEIINRIKVLAGLRTDEHATAQDGRIHHELPSGESLNARVSVAPTQHGENAVLRILPADKAVPSLEELGFSTEVRALLATAMARSSGMVLVTGPTGSGKTTTLHSLLALRDAATSSIVTLEDPVERELEGVTQMQVRERGGMGFASGLRAILRQDPDVIMLGEIRDNETAAVAVNAALTGHLLLSTLHTNDAVSALPRLIDMKVEPFLLASTVSLVLAQRLVRKACSQCAVTIAVSADVAESVATFGIIAGEKAVRALGCDACDGSGYIGRLCIAEVLVIDERMREAVLRRASAEALSQLAAAQGMKALRQSAALALREGRTTIEEILRVIS